jgi:hypothetical protein
VPEGQDSEKRKKMQVSFKLNLDEDIVAVVDSLVGIGPAPCPAISCLPSRPFPAPSRLDDMS